MSTSKSLTTSARFDLHGVVSIRVVDGHPRDVATVARQLGPIRVNDDPGPADITVRFVERIATTSRVRYLGRNEGGFTNESFLILRSKHKAQTRSLIPMESIGGTCEIVCEHGTPAVPLLLAIINLTAVSKGVLPLHAGAFEWRGKGVVVTGWSKGGKTETLLGYMSRGARYIADEWCYIDSHGQKIFGVPERVRLWHWQLAQLPHYRRRVPLSSRWKMGALGLIPTLQKTMPERWQRTSAGRALQRIAYFAADHQNTLVAPERLFEQGVSTSEGNFDRLILVMSAENQETIAEVVEPGLVADRMAHSLIFERQPLLHYYSMFRYAFPESCNPHLENLDEREAALLTSAFMNKPSLCVEHPYPVDLSKLFASMEEFIRNGA